MRFQELYGNTDSNQTNIHSRVERKHEFENLRMLVSGKNGK